MSTVAETFPERAALHPGRLTRDVPPGGLLDWFTTVDHKKIGIMYLVTSAVFFALAGLEALLMRIQLSQPRAEFLGPGAYNALFTMHGTTMIFLAVMPWLLGFANFIVPLQIGARDMAFPKLNALSYWLFLFGGLLLYFSFPAGVPPDVGWFAYAPLTERPYAMNQAVDYWNLGLLTSSIGTILTGVNLIATVAKLREPGMSPFQMPIFTWMSLVTGFLIIWCMPALTAAQVMLLFDRYLGADFFRVTEGGDAVFWQHLFWFFGHPEVYILALPAFGVVSEVIPVFSRQPIFGYKVVVFSGIAIAFYGFLVWAHHMFTVGLGMVGDAFFGASTMIIAVPTGVKIFSWLGTMWGGRIRFTTAMLFAVAVIGNFTIGGISGVHFAMFPIDWQTTDTYYVVAHFHYVVMGASLFGIFAATYYWFPKITGRLLDERLGKWNFWLIFVGGTLTFFPMHFVGLMGMPRRVYTYPDLPGWGSINLLVTIGAFVQLVGVLVFLWNIYVSLRRGERAGDNPWQAFTLEWATTSPPPAYNFDTLPPIRGERPLWDLEHPDEAVKGHDGKGDFKPGDPAGPSAAPPGRSSDAAYHAQSGHATARWFEHLSVPVFGTLTFISSEVFFFGALIVAYILYRATTNGGPGPEDLDVRTTALFSVALFASSGTIIMGERRLARGDLRGFQTWLLATIVLGTIFILGQVNEYRLLYQEGVTIDLSPFTSAFYTLTGFHGFHVVIGLVALAIIAGLSFAGDYRHGKRLAAVESVALYWHFVDLVWVVVFSVVYLWTLVGA